MNNLPHILESLLFVAEEPLTVDRLKNILETVEPKEIRTALAALAEQYETRGGGFGLYEVAGGWQLRSRPEYNQWIKRMLQPPPQRLTKATLETLAIVAYNQPIIRADIEHIRGVDCGGVLRQLMERKLIRVLGRKEIPGRPLIYATTKLFLELFDLKDLKDLPSPKEIEALTAERENIEEAPAEIGHGEIPRADVETSALLLPRSKESLPETIHAQTAIKPGVKKHLFRESCRLVPWHPPTPPGHHLRLGAAPARAAVGASKIKTDPPGIPATPPGPSTQVSPLPGSAHRSSVKDD